MSVVAHAATVEVLTAEVRVLMVGSRQVTLSVFRQLDILPYDSVEPMGRINDSRDDDVEWIIGRCREDDWVETLGSPPGTLVRARFDSSWTSVRDALCGVGTVPSDWNEITRLAGLSEARWLSQVFISARTKWTVPMLRDQATHFREWQDKYRREHYEFEALPLIVLAGLK